MTFRLKDIEVNARLPEIPADLPVFTARAATLEERRPALELLRSRLKLDGLQTVDDDDSLYFENAAGEIQFYRASGALWAENTLADAAFPDERRPWNVVEASNSESPDESRLVLVQSEADRLAKQSGDMFEEAGLLSPDAHFAGVSLDQVAKLDAQGKEIARAAGLANARFLYRLNDLDVDGPGAKTYAFFNPGADAPTLTGAYHAWRPPTGKRKVKLRRLDEIMERTIVRDPGLRAHHKRGGVIELHKVDLVYWAFRPEINQDYIFPVLRVHASVAYKDAANVREGFGFSRCYNAVTQRDCAAAQIHAHYLVDKSG